MKTKEFDDLYKLGSNPRRVIELENLIYVFARRLTNKAYDGGLWNSTLLNNDTDKEFWFFELDSKKEWNIVCENPISDDNLVSSKCLSLLAFSFALNYQMSAIYEEVTSSVLLDEIVRLYYTIRDNIDSLLDEHERKIFFQVVD